MIFLLYQYLNFSFSLVSKSVNIYIYIYLLTSPHYTALFSKQRQKTRLNWSKFWVIPSWYIFHTKNRVKNELFPAFVNGIFFWEGFYFRGNLKLLVNRTPFLFVCLNLLQDQNTLIFVRNINVLSTRSFLMIFLLFHICTYWQFDKNYIYWMFIIIITITITIVITIIFFLFILEIST